MMSLMAILSELIFQMVLYKWFRINDMD